MLTANVIPDCLHAIWVIVNSWKQLQSMLKRRWDKVIQDESSKQLKANIDWYWIFFVLCDAVEVEDLNKPSAIIYYQHICSTKVFQDNNIFSNNSLAGYWFTYHWCWDHEIFFPSNFYFGGLIANVEIVFWGTYFEKADKINSTLIFQCFSNFLQSVTTWVNVTISKYHHHYQPWIRWQSRLISNKKRRKDNA